MVVCAFLQRGHVLHIKYSDTECLCGHLHIIGQQTERIQSAASKGLRQELTAAGRTVDAVIDPLLALPPDTTSVYDEITCPPCLIRLERLLEQYPQLVTITPDRKITIKPPPDPEYRSIEDFAAFLKDNEHITYTHEDMGIVRAYLQISVDQFQQDMSKYGCSLGTREKPKRVRGFSDTSSIYSGPGSEKTHGGGSGF